MNREIFRTLEEACSHCGLLPPKEYRKVSYSDDVDGVHRRNGRILFMENHLNGYVKNWRTGVEALFFANFNEEREMPLSAKERKEREIRIRAFQRKERHLALMRCNAVAQLAGEILAGARVSHEHAYLLKKGIAQVRFAPCHVIEANRCQKLIEKARIQQMDGSEQKVGYCGELLLIPLCTVSGIVRTLQMITPEGRKIFLKGGEVKGLMYRNEAMFASGKRCIGVAEGVATAVSVDAMFDVPTVAAMSAGNVPHVVEKIRGAYPGLRICVFSDVDENGVGLKAARAAVKDVKNTEIFTPTFTGEELERFAKCHHGSLPTDFNDLMLLRKEKGGQGERYVW